MGCWVSPPDAKRIRNDCKVLKEIVIASSLDYGEETRLLNEIDAIAQTSTARPDEAAYRLHLQTEYLRATDNGRGEAILSGEQYRKLFDSDDKE